MHRFCPCSSASLRPVVQGPSEDVTCCACRLRRPLDIVNVVMVSTTDGVLERKCVEQYKLYMEKNGVTGTTAVRCIDRCG